MEASAPGSVNSQVPGAFPGESSEYNHLHASSQSPEQALEPQPSSENHQDPPPAVEAGNHDDDVDAMEDAEEPHVRENAVYLYGVDELDTKAVEAFVKKAYPQAFFLEWVDDHSLNVVYDDPEDAFQALVAMTAEDEFDAPEPIAPTQLRRTRPHPWARFNGLQLWTRFGTDSDVKASDSRARSDYYKKHGTPSHREDIVRFGTARSAPMRYGLDGVDVLPKRKHASTKQDLFPSKVSGDDVDMVNDDLHDGKPRRRGNRGGRRRKRGGNSGGSRAEEPDLFAEKLAGRNTGSKVGKSRSQRSSRRRQPNQSTPPDKPSNFTESTATPAAEPQQSASIYANMEY